MRNTILAIITVGAIGQMASPFFLATGSPLPPGAILLFTSGSCPSGTDEAADLNGLTIVGATVASGTAGTTGGSDNITPAGTNSAISMSGSVAAEASHTHDVTAAGTNGSVSFTPAGTIAWPAGVPTFSGSALGTHTHTYTDIVNHTHTITITDPGHVHVQSVNSATTGGASGYTPDTSTNTTSTSGYSTASATTGITASSANPGGGGASGTTAATSGGTPAGTVAWPAGVPALTGTSGTVSAQTFTGSAVTSTAGSSHLHAAGTLAASTPSFTGTQFDNRSAFMRAIACRVQ